MKTIQLGKNGPEVSAIGLGIMGMNDMYRTKDIHNDAESVQTIEASPHMGINFVDTGDGNGTRHNELLIREALKGRKEEPVISVRFGVLRSPHVEWLEFDARQEAVKNLAAYSFINNNRTIIVNVFKSCRRQF